MGEPPGEASALAPVVLEPEDKSATTGIAKTEMSAAEDLEQGYRSESDGKSALTGIVKSEMFAAEASVLGAGLESKDKLLVN